MKKRRKFCGFLAFLVLLAVALIPAGKSQAAKLPPLKVKGTKLMNSRGRTVQLKGVSTHGLSWYPQYVNQKAFTYMKKYWKINAVRLALYTADYNGYCNSDYANRLKLLKTVDQGIKSATSAGLYVIVDWHILKRRKSPDQPEPGHFLFRKNGEEVQEQHERDLRDLQRAKRWHLLEYDPYLCGKGHPDNPEI